MQQLLSAVAWRQLFQITNNTYEQKAIKVSSTFEMSRDTINLHNANFIQFQDFGALHGMSLTEFSIHLGLYDAEFICISTYEALLTFRLVEEPLSDTW